MKQTLYHKSSNARKKFQIKPMVRISLLSTSKDAKKINKRLQINYDILVISWILEVNWIRDDYNTPLNIWVPYT